MTILVTGGCGYVGTKLVAALLARRTPPHAVRVLDIQWFGNYLTPHHRLSVQNGDVRDIDLVDLRGVDVVVHLANIANDAAAAIDPYLSWEVNVLAGMRLADRAARQGVGHFVYASSASVYGLQTAERVTEELPLVPISEYNKTKMVAERVVMSYANQMLTTIVRPATVCGYSPRMRLDLTVNLLTMQALTAGAITVLGGSQTRPNIHIDDLVDCYIFLIERRIGGVFNAGFENMTVRAIADLIAAEVPVPILTKPSNDPRSYAVCSDRLLATGFRRRRDVATAIHDVVEAYRAGWFTETTASSYNIAWMKQREFR